MATSSPFLFLLMKVRVMRRSTTVITERVGNMMAVTARSGAVMLDGGMWFLAWSSGPAAVVNGRSIVAQHSMWKIELPCHGVRECICRHGSREVGSFSYRSHGEEENNNDPIKLLKSKIGVPVQPKYRRVAKGPNAIQITTDINVVSLVAGTVRQAMILYLFEDVFNCRKIVEDGGVPHTTHYEEPSSSSSYSLDTVAHNEDSRIRLIIANHAGRLKIR